MTLTDHGTLFVGLERLLAQRPAGSPADPVVRRWRQALRAESAPVRELLAGEPDQPADWMSARRSVALRERNALLGRLARWRAMAVADPDLDRLCLELGRLLADVRHHVQRMHDLAYDKVEIEVGGSE